LSAALLLVLFAGCGFLKSKPNQLFSLQTMGPDAPIAATTTRVAIEGIELPPGLDRREIAVRGDDGQLEVRGTQLWAGPLEDMVIHTLAFDLAKRLPEGMVVLPGQGKPTGTVRTIFVVFEDLAAGKDRTFVLDARLTSGTTTWHERITVPMESMDSADVALAMSTALSTLADRVAVR
jgi:uncharacterized lipoprotein YmbA